MKLTKAKEIVLQRIPNEIFVGHNAISVYISLSDHAESLNASHFKDALSSVQQHSLDAFILSLCKIYEKQNTRHPNYSIPTAIAYLREDMTGLHSGIQNHHIKLEQFIQAQIDSSFSVTSETDLERIPEMIVTWLDDRRPQIPARGGYELDQVLNALRVLRDKRVAHHEDNNLQGLSKTDLDSALRLLEFAQTFVNLGYDFFGSSRNGIVSPGTFAPSKSIIWPQMQKLLKILEGENGRC